MTGPSKLNLRRSDWVYAIVPNPAYLRWRREQIGADR